MPWTFAHPAAVLPLRRWSHRLPFAGLVLGSMAPDFGYYVGAFDLAHHAHQPLGWFTLCLLPGLAIAWLLHTWRARFIALLPQPHRGALAAAFLTAAASPADGGPAAVARAGHGLPWLATSAAVVLGAATHTVWDAFTHSHGFAVRAWSGLQQPLVEFGGRRLFVYNTLQHASTLVGVGCLLWVYRRWLSRQRSVARLDNDGLDRARFGMLVGGVGVAAALAFAWTMLELEAPPGPYRNSIILVSTVIRTTSLYALWLVAAAWAWPRWAARRSH